MIENEKTTVKIGELTDTESDDNADIMLGKLNDDDGYDTTVTVLQKVEKIVPEHTIMEWEEIT